MLQPLLTFLTSSSIGMLTNIFADIAQDFPDAWKHADRPIKQEDDPDANNGGDDDEVYQSTGTSLAFKEFLQFLELGCSGVPVQEYPTVVIVLSTMPSSVRDSCSH